MGHASDGRNHDTSQLYPNADVGLWDDSDPSHIKLVQFWGYFFIINRREKERSTRNLNTNISGSGSAILYWQP